MQKLWPKLISIYMVLFMALPAFANDNYAIYVNNQPINDALKEYAGQDVNSSTYHTMEYNENTGQITVYQENKLKTSDICAYTDAYQYTDTDTGQTMMIGRNPESGQVDMNYYEYTASNGQRMQVTATTFNAEISQKIMEDVRAGKNVQIDNVMVVSIDGGKTWSAEFNPVTGQMELNADWVKDNPYASMILQASGGDGAFGYLEGDKFAFETFPWANKEGWLTNFKKILKLHNGNLLEFTQEEWDTLFPPGDDPEIPEPGDVQNSFIKRSTTGVGDWDGDEDQEPGLSMGKVDYYNDSRNYNEGGFHRGFADPFDSDGNGPGIIIPSSEKLLAGIRARTYAGTAAISLGMAEKEFTYDEFGFDFTEFRYKLVPPQEVEDYDAEGNYEGSHIEPEHYEIKDSREWKRYWEAPGQTEQVTGRCTRLANFLYISDLDMYDFKSAGVANDSYGSTEFKNDDSHCLEDILPQEDGNGDPIGPVDSADGYSLRNDRPNYEVLVRSISESPMTGAGEGTPQDEFPAGEGKEYPEHITWGEIGNVEEDDRYLGWFSQSLYGGPYGDEAVPEFSWPQSGTVSTPGGAQSVANLRMESWVGKGVDADLSNEKHVKYMQGVEYYAETKTDGLKLGYDQNVVIEEAVAPVRFNEDESCFTRFIASECKKTGKWPSYLANYITSAMSNMTQYITEVPDNETYESTPAFSLAQVEIPENKKNGKYTTSRTGFEYTPILYYSSTAPVSEGGDYKSEYYNNEPIIVQTPVVAPVTLYDDPDKQNGDGSQMVPTSYTGPDQERFQLPINTLPTVDGTPKGVSDQTNRKTQHLYTGEGVGRDDNLVQLRLDETYWLKFDPMTHLKTQGYSDIEKAYDGKFDNTWSDGDIKFDKYVQAKYIHFPFAVGVYMGDDEKPTYYPLVTDENAEGYWIPIYKKGENTANLVWTRFYIPSWALEGAYSDEEDCIKYKVESINVTDDSGVIHDGDDAQHELLNDEAYDEESGVLNEGELHSVTDADQQLYIATYNIGVQVSGWVYDFQVVGINNRDAYDTDMSDVLSGSWHDLYYPFAWNFEEKRGGDKNRLGGDSRYTAESAYVRYTRNGQLAYDGDTVDNSKLLRSGSMTPKWNIKNTVILDNTKSHKYKDSGTLPKGTEFAFSVKTMQNLWNPGDYLEIAPTFWYQDDSGTTYTQQTGLHLYYNDNSGSTENMLIEYDSDRDHTAMKNVTLSNEMFNGSYLDDDLAKTVRAATPFYNADTASFQSEDITNAELENRMNQFKMKQTASYNLSSIKLTSSLRLFTGSVDQYKTNLTVDKDDPRVQPLNGGIFKSSYDLSPGSMITSDVETCVNPSIQTWYGCYTIPSSLHASLMDPAQLKEYAKTHGGIPDDDPNVWLTDGYLIVNFDIMTHNSEDPSKDLSYGGHYAHNENMWTDQNQDLTAEVGDPGAGNYPQYDPSDPENKVPNPGEPDLQTPSDPHYDPHNITVNPGDVVVVDMKDSIDKMFTAHIWTIQ